VTGGVFGGGGIPQTPPGRQPQPFGSNPFGGSLGQLGGGLRQRQFDNFSGQQRGGGLRQRQFDNFSGQQRGPFAGLRFTQQPQQQGSLGNLRQQVFGNPFGG
jgi:hypothetical protein